jgi:hypothetical protein
MHALVLFHRFHLVLLVLVLLRHLVLLLLLHLLLFSSLFHLFDKELSLGLLFEGFVELFFSLFGHLVDVLLIDFAVSIDDLFLVVDENRRLLML